MTTFIETIVDIFECAMGALCIIGLLAMAFSILVIIRGEISSSNLNLSPLNLFYAAGGMAVTCGLMWLVITQIRHK